MSQETIRSTPGRSAPRDDKSSFPVALRSPSVVMNLERLGSFHQCRLSFMRILLRRMKREKWTFDRPIFDIDKSGVGTAVYTAQSPHRCYSLICFGHNISAEQRSDRVIANAWDSTFTLFDGRPTLDDIKRLAKNVPGQEAGRITDSEITLSRANRSVRMFDHTIDRLSQGKQPDAQNVQAIGYLMRTTAVYGSGKFGATIYDTISTRSEFQAPFQAEMLTVYLIRMYTLDLAEHIAELRSPETAVRIDPDLRQQFGVGNSTGLGMAPFVINRPALFSSWIAAREEALSRVRSIKQPTTSEQNSFLDALRLAIDGAERWHTSHPVQISKLAGLKADLKLLSEHCTAAALQQHFAWDKLYEWAEQNLSVEGQEQLVSLMLEPYETLVDPLADAMGCNEDATFRLDGSMSVGMLRSATEETYGWANNINWDARDSQARVWYVSQEKLEPRLGERFQEPIAAYERPLAPARDAISMLRDLASWSDEVTTADFLLSCPQHRHTARRAQLARHFPYGEIRNNTVGADLMPIDMLRCKLAFFGATHFDPRSDRWVRINMFQNAPFPEELCNGDATET